MGSRSGLNPLFRPGYSCEALFLPPELTSAFAAWIETYYGCLEPKTFDVDAFNRRGRELAQALKAHLGPDSYVEFVPEQADDGIGKAEVIV